VYKTLLHQLEISYGICGQARRWITFFLFDRSQVVTFVGCKSTPQSLSCGVPQGSVLGPLLFVLYSADIISVAANHDVCIHAYAEDMQTYASRAAQDHQTATSRLLACVTDINN